MSNPVTRNQTVVFFDLDLTLTNIDTFRYFLRVYYLSSPARAHLALYVLAVGLLRKFRFVPMSAFKEKALIGLRRMSRYVILELGLEIFKSGLKQHIRTQAIEQIRLHKNNGDRVYILTAAPDIYVKAFADYLGCDGYFATELEFNNDIFTGRIKGSDLTGAEKKNRLEKFLRAEGISARNVYAYADHKSDLPLLDSVGNPVAVSPSSGLKNAAIKRNWPIKRW